MVCFLTLRPVNSKTNKDIKKLVRPIKRVAHAHNYAVELHPTNKYGQRDLHLHILIETTNIQQFKQRLQYFLRGWELAYIQTARQPLNALSYMSRQNNAEPVHYKGNLAALCEL